MEIRVEREISFRLAVHGRLLIDGDRVCDTLENGATCMKPGSYPLVRSYSLFSAANGIHRLGEKIAVGEWQYLGFLVRTQPVREQLLTYIRQLRHRQVPPRPRHQRGGDAATVIYQKSRGDFPSPRLCFAIYRYCPMIS